MLDLYLVNRLIDLWFAEDIGHDHALGRVGGGEKEAP